jgi:hypothetical protein
MIVLFEAEIEIEESEYIKFSNECGLGARALEQAVQDKVGHTGAKVTCVFEVD